MRRTLAGLTLACALVLATAATAAAENGNVATGSVGTVQVGNVTSDPAVVADESAAEAAATVPVSVTRSGGNTAEQSVGSVQVGGGNTASDSAGTVQVSASRAEPAVSVDLGGSTADIAAPAAVGGSGSNSSDGSVGTVQAGGGNSSNDGAVTVQARSVEASPAVETDLVGGDLAFALDVQTGTDEGVDVESLRIEAEQIGVTPDFLLAVDAIARLEAGGTISTAPSAGNTADDSFLTAQTGGITADPQLALTSDSLASSAELNGGTSVDGAGTNSATSSLGSVQAGGGNGAVDSVGTVQVAGAQVAPALSVQTPLGEVVLGGSTGIEDGANSADRSLGTVQVGGGNNAGDSAGTAQVSALTFGPTLAASDTPVGNVALAGSSAVAGSGNEATGSIVTVQVGGGNSADNSTGTTQEGPISVGQSVVYDDTPAGDGTVAAPTRIGSVSGNTAGDSAGTIQVGGGNTARNAIGTTQVGGSGTRTLASAAAAPAPSASAAVPPAADAGTPAAPEAPVTSVAGAARLEQQMSAPAGPSPRRLAETVTLASLPFTGMSLMLLVLLGLGLATAGLGMRKCAEA